MCIGREVPSIEFYANAEWFNPGEPVKDRPSKYLSERFWDED